MINLRDIGFIALLGLLATMGCRSAQLEGGDQEQQGQVTGDKIPQLKIGERAEFSAVIGKLSANNCIEVFVPDEYEKYKGDAIWAIPSRLATSVSPLGLSEGKKAVVAGTMIRIKDSEDPLKTCNIVTGNLFEITAIR